MIDVTKIIDQQEKIKFERYGNRTRVLSLEGSYVTTTSTVQLTAAALQLLPLELTDYKLYK